MHRARAGARALLSVTFVLSLSTSCASDVAERRVSFANDDVPSMVLGRSFDVTIYDAEGRPNRESVEVGADDPALSTLLDALRSICELDVGATTRFGEGVGYLPPRRPVPAGDMCGLAGAREQQVLLCTGYRLMSMSETVVPIDIRVDSTTGLETFRPRVLLEEEPAGAPPASLTIPVQDASGAATLALWATVAFQKAALLGAQLVDPDHCVDGSLYGTLPPYEGHDSTERVPLSFVVAAATGDALTQLEDVSNAARERIRAASTERVSADRDRARAARSRFRGERDSLLEATRVMLAVPSRMFDKKSKGTIGGDDEVRSGEYATCGGGPQETGDGPAYELMISTMIDPRIEPSQMDAGVAEARLRTALEEDHPDTFATPELAGLSDAAFFDRLGISTGSIRRSALQLQEESRVFGRPLIPVPGSSMAAPRVYGTSPNRGRVDPGILFARSAGAARFEHQTGARHAPVADYGTFGILDPASGYGSLAVLDTVDVVGAALARAVSRDDMRRTDAGFPPFTEALEAVTASRMHARSKVPMRMETCVGLASASGETVSSLRVRLYTDDPDPSRFGIWIGEEGLQCAGSGRIEGVSCSPEAHRVSPTAGALRTGATSSGFGTDYIEWVVAAEDLPDALQDPAGIPVGLRMYVMESSSASRDTIGPSRTAIGALSTDPGEATTGEHSRCTLSPAGRAVMEAANDTAPSPEDCSEPEKPCADLLRDVRVPLEDEIVEALDGTGGDDLDSSFVHYLRIARQAADEADQLGEQVVQQGLEMDVRAEAAAEQLEQLCGDAVNVSTLPGIAPSDPCMADGECGDCYGCIAGYCQPDELCAFIDEGETGGLNQCLGVGSPLISVSLGSEPFCQWRVGDAAPCDPESLGDFDDPTSLANALCSDEVGGLNMGCPECSYFPGPAGCEDHPDIDEAMLPSGHQLSLYHVEPLYLVESGAQASVGTNECIELVRLMRGWTPATFVPSDSAADGVKDDRWISHDVLLPAAQSVSHMMGPLGFTGARLNGRPWMSTGTLTNGGSGSWPCASRLGPSLTAELCTGGPTQPIACGFPGTCATWGGRSWLTGELWRRVRALQMLAGADHQYEPFVYTTSASGPALYSPVAPSILDDPTLCEAMNLSSFHTLRTSCQGSGPEPQLMTVMVAGKGPRTCISGIAPGSGVEEEEIHVAFCGYYFEPAAVVATPLNTGSSAVFQGGGLVDQALELYASGQVDENQPIDISQFSPSGADHGGIASAIDSWKAHSASGHTIQTYRDLLHALELGCWARVDGGGGGGCSAQLDDLPPIQSAEDLDGLQQRLVCVADRFDQIVANLTLTDIPEDLAEQLRYGSIEPSYPSYRGEYGQVVGELRASLQSLPAATQQVSSVVRDFAGVIQLARSQIDVLETQAEIQHWQTVGTIANEVARCASAIASSGTLDLAASAGGVVSAAAQCTAAAVQLVGALETAVLESEITDQQIKQVLLQAVMDFGSRMDALAGAEHQIKEAYARINAILAKLAQIRAQAEREVAKVLFLDSDEVGREYQVNTVMRTRMSTLRIRYEDALDNARNLSCMARYGIEQRLGVDLTSQRFSEDMTLVEAPKQWADDAASLGGIDYQRIRGELEGPIHDYAGEYIGDYVRRLELFLESYRIDHPFENGQDVSVISLRDDVHRVREECDVESHNLLTWSADPLQLGWDVECNAGERCVAPSPAPETDPPLFRDIPDATGGPPRIRSLGKAAPMVLSSVCAEADWDGMTCSAVPGGRFFQSLSLAAGEHLVSWYEKLPVSLDASGTHAMACETSCATSCPAMDTACIAACEDECLQTACAMEALPSTTPAIDMLVTGDAADPMMQPAVIAAPAYLDPASDRWVDRCWWRRVYARVDVPEAQTVEIGWQNVVSPTETAHTVSVGWSAPQVERLSPAEAAVASLAPHPFFPTDDDRISLLAWCEDTDGSKFRSPTYWARRCEYVCSDGVGEHCVGEDVPDRARLRCFYETDFTISQNDIERGELIPTGGFALGNYNYRHGTFAVNLVGTSIRDCASADNPASCYASGFVPFSLTHTGPFTVRNHFGDEVNARLFDGRIEHAKALTAERYLTNPISSADRGLLTDYVRTELRGRTLPGHYTLRIYDTPGLDWSNVEDVQLVLDYQYWTRFE